MSTTPITPELAFLLERAEGRHLTRQVEICVQLRPELGAHVISVAGGVAFTSGEYGRKLNHVTGYGMNGDPVREDELILLEKAYAKLGLATEIDLCPFVSRDTLKLLAKRGYAVSAFSNTYVMAIDHARSKSPVDSALKIDVVTAADRNDFLEASLAGFSTEQPARPALLLQMLAKIATMREDTRLYVARFNGQIVGSAGLGLIDLTDTTVAHLYIASTLPAYRGRGVQQALIQARLADAKRAGVKLASIAARPASSSSRNALRAGFELAYTKSTFASPELQKTAVGS